MTITAGAANAVELPADVNAFQYWNGSTWVAVPGDGQLTIAAGATFVDLRVDPAADTIYEGLENFNVNVTAASTNGQTLTVTTPTAAGTIADEGNNLGDLPSFRINDVTVDEAAGTITFTVTKDGLTELPSSVIYTVAPNTAVLGGVGVGDYTAGISALSGTLNFAAGVATQTITLNITNDTVPEATETFFVNLSGASGAIISDAQGIGTITDNDLPPRNILDGVMKTNTNVTNQFITLSWIDQADPTRAAAKIYDLSLQGQQGLVLQDVGFNINPDNNYLVTLEASSGTKAIVTDFSLEGVLIQGSGNAQLELNDTSATNSTSTAITAIVNPDNVATPTYDGVLVQAKTESTDGDAAGTTITDSLASTFNYLYGAGGGDTLIGSGGSDILNGGPGLDTLNGNGGNDILVYDSVNNDYIDGGLGFDILRVDAGALQLSLAGSSNPLNTLTVNPIVDLTGKNIHNIEAILITEEAGASTLATDPNDDIGTTLILRAQDVLNFTDSNDTLHVMGSPGDKLDLHTADIWIQGATVDGFVTYTSATLAVTLLVDSNIQVI